jgi:hypothetical protein
MRLMAMCKAIARLAGHGACKVTTPSAKCFSWPQGTAVVDILHAAVGATSIPCRVLLVRPHGGALLRIGTLTPYAAEVLAADALRAGSGTTLALTVPADTRDAEVASLEARVGWLRERGVQVTVTRQGAG